jgi:hypothetical protein
MAAFIEDSEQILPPTDSGNKTRHQISSREEEYDDDEEEYDDDDDEEYDDGTNNTRDLLFKAPLCSRGYHMMTKDEYIKYTAAVEESEVNKPFLCLMN